jgi:hypothetical protein
VCGAKTAAPGAMRRHRRSWANTSDNARGDLSPRSPLPASARRPAVRPPRLRPAGAHCRLSARHPRPRRAPLDGRASAIRSRHASRRDLSLRPPRAARGRRPAPCARPNRHASSLRPRHHEVGLPAAALAADEPLVPVRDGQIVAVALCHLGGVGLDLVPALAAPHDQTNASRRRGSQCHRWASVSVHRRRPHLSRG